jgi:hypothetical protein
MALIVSFTYCSKLRESNYPQGRSLEGREYRLIKETTIPLDTHLRAPAVIGTSPGVLRGEVPMTVGIRS